MLQERELIEQVAIVRRELDALNSAVRRLESALGSQDAQPMRLAESLSPVQAAFLADVSKGPVDEDSFCSRHGISARELGGIKTVLTKALRSGDVDVPLVAKRPRAWEYEESEAGTWIVRCATPEITAFLQGAAKHLPD